MTKKLVRGLGVGWLVLVAASCVGTEESTDENPVKGERSSGDDIQQALQSLPSAQVVDVGEDGVPTFITGQLGRIASLKPGTKDLRPVVANVAKVFRANPENLDLDTARSVVGEAGDQHFRFNQTKNGLKVLGGELIIHLKDGAVYAANGSARHDLTATDPKSAKINASAAVTAARDTMAEDVMEAAAEANPALAYRLAETGNKLDLVYVVRVNGTKKDLTPVVDDVLVSAADGSIVDRIPHILTAKNREVHNTKTSTTLPGPIARTETGAASGEKTVDDNFTKLGQVYDAYKTLFNRDSFDNAGAKLISTVHYDKNYVNAYWDGTQMVYGDGDGVNASNLAESLDVTGHELTHAVTERTSNLTYSGQSGGLNESMSDIFGNGVEWFRDVAGDTSQPPNVNNFLVGDDVWTPGTAGDALRYMCNPSQDGGSIDFATQFTSGLDVHYSSGLPNLVFCLLVKGGVHPKGKSTVNVTGVGMLKALNIFYKANTTIFTASETYAKAKTDTEQAATLLFGAGSPEVASVTAAWQAVGVGGGTTPPPTSGVLTNGVGVSVSGAANSQSNFTLAVPSGATALKFALSGGSGDADMYVKFGSAPTTTSFDCRPFLNGNNETCNITTAKVGTYFVLLNGFSSYSGATLKGSFTGGSTPPPTTTCAHDECVAGVALKTGCSAAATAVIAADSFCGSSSWDSICVGEATSIGGKACLK